MGVRFIIGRAGSGKTHYCIEQIAQRLRESAGEGQHLFLLVPEQASLQMERAILECPGIRGFARCEVLSFRRLAYRVFNASGGVIQTIRPIARLMVLRHLVAGLEKDLRVFGRQGGRVGVVAAIERTIDELIREDVTPDDLARLLSDVIGQDDLLSARLHDVHTLYRGYLDRLGSDLADPGHCLRIVRERLAAYAPLAGSLIWADGFAGLTRQEQSLLVALAGVAEQLEISLLIDPSSPVVSEGAAVEPFHLFARTERTYARLVRALHEAGISPASPLTLRGEAGRFAASPVLARLERDLFAAAPPPRAAEETAESRNGQHANTLPSHASSPSEACGDEIQLVQAATRRVEVAAAVAEIQRLIRRPGSTLRYRDIAIIVRDLGPYHDILSAALSAAGIPFFIDRRRPIGHHALVECVHSAIELAVRVDIETVATFIKTGLTGLDDDQADMLENFVRAHAVTGREPWLQSDDWRPRPRPSQRRGEEDPTASAERDLEAVNRSRRYLAGLWGVWWRRASPDGAEPPSARQWVEGLMQLFTGMGVLQRMAAWADAAELAGRHQEAQEHRQVWQQVMELLGDLAGLFGDEPLTIGALAEVVDTALAGATLGLTPPTLDQVLVGSIERSRHPAIRAAFVMGFAEGEFPQRPAEDPIFSDRSREEFARRGVELAPSSRQQLFDERMLAYIALTRPSERLWVSWPAVDDEGRTLRPSPWLVHLKAALPGAVLERRLSEPSSDRSMWSITTPADLVAALAADFRLRRGRTKASDGDIACDRRWNALYDVARRDETIRGSLRSALTSLTYRNRAELQAGTMLRALSDPLRASVSRIETFASCPFRHFADYLLDLEPRAEWELEAVDLGLICHRVLERYVGQLVAQRQRLDSVAEEEIPSIIRHLSEEATKELVDELLRGDPRNAYILSRGETDLTRVLDAQRFVASAGEFSPCGVEVSFGMSTPSSPSPDQRSLPALPITTPRGRKVLLRGRIDRVDLAEAGGRYLAAVIDYKRSVGRRLTLAKAFHGLDLQLLAYLLVIREHGRRLASRSVEPAAAFYVALLGGLRSVDEPPSEPLKPEERYTSLKPRGIVDWQCVPSLDVHMSGPSKVISAHMKKDGNPGNLHTTDVADHDTFLALLDQADQSMGELCDRMLDGDVSVSPYCLGTETACRWCHYPSVCRYEFDAQGMRFLPGMSRQQALDRLERRGGGTLHDR